ncbi:Histone deacetylase superfamily protein [uncultured Desulfobacterium sp.]|uniref:Acetoin utilization protein AcuC n=1 Tax=uncultured Desulfobacterium sp. TaxID=201089 RepID=A0A445N2N4_9BACT|nr:Histone deacetylase superfamily protein [uncultured Desulfobacterium sp.]
MKPPKTAFIYSDAFLRFKPPEGYPWSVKRTEATYQLCRKLKLLNHEWISVYSPVPARESDLLSFHDKRYLATLKKANEGIFKERWLKSGLGTTECPVYKGVYDYCLLATGATLLGVKLIDEGSADIAFNPTGGFHHAGRDFAAGFCYVNDVVLAAKRFVDRKKRVLYVDIDAHYGDQVAEAFYGSSRVMTLSFHESGKTLFPFKTGFEDETGKGRGRGYCVNVPMPANTGDEEFMWAFKRIFPPLIRSYKPDVVIAALGVDGLVLDPLSNLKLTNIGFSQAVQMIKDNSPKLLAVGCGGYSLDTSARAWTLAWAIMNGLGCDEEDLMSFGGTFWGDGVCALRDTPSFIPDEIRKKNMKEIRRVVTAIRQTVFPVQNIVH